MLRVLTVILRTPRFGVVVQSRICVTPNAAPFLGV
jgi:hypothetical protein